MRFSLRCSRCVVVAVLASGCTYTHVSPLELSTAHPANPDAEPGILYEPRELLSKADPVPETDGVVPPNSGDDKLDHEGHGSADAPIPASSDTPKDTTYTCPMHAEVRQGTPGKCPKCGMALEPDKPQNADHEHEH